ncbi:DUF456 domain-containing protein [Verrucomicrobiaceae bacterium 5K15]|uniref:DUF456 domain-containing protein n=1 Tax=Oceaniferula flava TaxID=2800421 RepID=A0AAE2SCI3_9BACT|nr:DUF456 domain-containing protein [Oceaniferula flavus]MBK1855680.1 DUF456 domain-containing protein [Oceaniferula flavus]MBM1136986.1 DUF456 domain-containing protein [Oceaniferula flavus]
MADYLPIIGSSLAWIVTVCLLISGFIGTLVPFLPGHLIIFLAAVGHWLMLREDSGVEWWTFAVLALLLIVSQVLEFLSGAMGTRWFGGSRWGAAGALIGGIVGMFFMPFGLILGPLIGAMLFEFSFAKKEVRESTVSGVGSVLGTVAGLIVKVIVGVMMIVWFVVDVFWISAA